jgi:DNA replication protein DnaC
MCECENKQYLQEREAFRAIQERDLIERRRSTCFHGNYAMYDSKFSQDDGKGDRNVFNIFRNYADNFETALTENHGLLIYGNVGSGKTFAAACITNQVLENGYTAYFTNFAEIKNNLWNVENKQAFINDVCSYDLLVIDDFGTESKSSYTSEIVTNIFDTRVNKQKPMILTSNFTPEQLKKCGEIEYQRIISRVLGNCMAIKYVGDDRRNIGRTRHYGFYQKISGGA